MCMINAQPLVPDTKVPIFGYKILKYFPKGHPNFINMIESKFQFGNRPLNIKPYEGGNYYSPWYDHPFDHWEIMKWKKARGHVYVSPEKSYEGVFHVYARKKDAQRALAQYKKTIGGRKSSLHSFVLCVMELNKVLFVGKGPKGEKQYGAKEARLIDVIP